MPLDSEGVEGSDVPLFRVIGTTGTRGELVAKHEPGRAVDTRAKSRSLVEAINAAQ